MSTTALVTADELLAMPTGMGRRYELVAGELRMMSPAGWRHGRIVSRLHTRIASHVDVHDLGITFGAETGFRLATNPDTVRAPDIAFIASKNVPREMPQDGFWPGAPDLAVEVISPGDRATEIDDKIETWLDAGCLAVWVVDPKLKTVTIYRSRTNVEVKSATEAIDGGMLLPGFSCRVGELLS